MNINKIQEYCIKTLKSMCGIPAAWGSKEQVEAQAAQLLCVLYVSKDLDAEICRESVIKTFSVGCRYEVESYEQIKTWIEEQLEFLNIEVSDTKYVCEDCGSENLYEACWINVQTQKPDYTWDPPTGDPAYCLDCDSHTEWKEVKL